jgi:hypothetical protein
MTRIEVNEDYRKLRARSYPSVGEQLDAIWKILLALEEGCPAPQDALDVRSRILSVKRGAPKPQSP